MKKYQSEKYLSAQQIAVGWGVSRWTAARTMVRYGYGGVKFGAARRWTVTEVEKVEVLAGMGGGALRPKPADDLSSGTNRIPPAKSSRSADEIKNSDDGNSPTEVV